MSPNSTTRPDKGYDFQPRLLFWKKYSPNLSGATCLKYAVAQTWDSTFKGIFADQSAINVISQVFPQATSYNRDDSGSPVLSYGNVWVRDYDDANNTYGAYSIGNGLYQTYYKQMIEMVKENPRVRTLQVNLKIKDINF